MTFIKRIAEHFKELNHPTSNDLLKAIKALKTTKEDIAPYLREPEHHPYGRQLIYKNDHIEILVMKWSSLLDCSPHDHGKSFGWIQILSGDTSHQLYRVSPGGWPEPAQLKKETAGSHLAVSRGMVHKMGSANTTEPLVTFHVYSPPISGMKVYDLTKCAACIVSDDCGAWWPEEQKQRLKTIRLTPNRNTP